MQAKYNEATINRPKGDRVIDAPFVQIDVEKYSRQLKKEPAWEKSDRNSITVFKTVGFTMVIMRLHKDASMNNSVDGLLTIQVLEGSIECMVGSKSTTVDKNQLVTLHPEVVHTIRAREDSLLLLTNNIAV
jgi:quercetin dioxygenase-like cupin family protein